MPDSAMPPTGDFRMPQLHQPQDKIRLGQGHTLKDRRWALGDERWTVYEQALLAALDERNWKLAELNLKLLKAKFPQSLRVRRLQGMIMEAQGQLDQAMGVYTSILDEDPLNAPAWKQTVSIAKAADDLPEAIKRLNEYIRVFQADAQAWEDLAALYKQTEHSEMAAFCLEELVLLSPLNPSYHSRLAACYCTMAGLEELRLARKHYAHAAEITGGEDNEALEGLCKACHAIAESDKSDKSDSAVNAALFDYAAKRLKAFYAHTDNDRPSKVEANVAEQWSAVQPR